MWLAYAVLGLAAFGSGVLLAAGATVTAVAVEHLLSSHRKKKNHVAPVRRRPAPADTLADIPRYRAGAASLGRPPAPCAPGCPHHPGDPELTRWPSSRSWSS